MAFEVRHGGLIALRVAGAWAGALIEGASGSGKSDLALRALGQGFRMAADDRVIVFACQRRLFGRAPAVLGGLIECRGLGVLAETHLTLARVAIKVRCERDSTLIERLPETAYENIQGIEIPVVSLCPFEDSAPAKIRRALESLGAERRRGYQASCASRG